MTYILNIETATKNCSVSLAKNGETILCKEIAEQGYSHAEKLHVFIEEIVKEANVNFSEIKAVAVSKGPGSYTVCALAFRRQKDCVMHYKFR